jgi:hypothetical protein
MENQDLCRNTFGREKEADHIPPTLRSIRTAPEDKTNTIPVFRPRSVQITPTHPKSSPCKTPSSSARMKPTPDEKPKPPRG